jgi:serine phosphatase RsbU (regulator of sigma subunit)
MSSPSRTDVSHHSLRRFAQRTGFVTSASAVLLAMVIAALLMRHALEDAAESHRRDLGALLVSSCEAALALGDRALLQDTLDELSPRLAELIDVEARDTSGAKVAGWRRDGEPGSIVAVPYSAAVRDAQGRPIGTLRLVVSDERARLAVRKVWLLLGAIAAASLAVAWAASSFLGKEIDEKSRLEGELELAERIQTSLLPKRLALPSADVAACMIPADEVGGDYYDVIPTNDGGWICIGDVVGHGLPAGLTMLMLQSGLGTFLRHTPDAAPREAIRAINRVVHENTRERLGESRYATLLVLRYHSDGSIRFGGGHLDLILYRRGADRSLLVPAPGPFVGFEPELDAASIDETELRLGEGDLLVLYTDGLTEARDSRGAMLGPDRLRELVEQRRSEPVEEIVAGVLKAVREFSPEQRDDRTILALRHRANSPLET